MKSITIDHLTRVEGNGGISATIDGRVVTEVKFNVYEGPRLIERLTVGRTPDEDVSLAPRICAICTVSHKNAVIRAMENALGVKVPEKVRLSRELMHMGEMVESHSLHTFLLALPDYLGYPNAIAMAAACGFEAKIGLEMKNFGNHIMKTYAGRFIHGENPVIGGFGKYPSEEDLQFIKCRALQFMPFVHKTVNLFCGLDYPDTPEAETLYVCCEPGEDRYGFWGDEILLSSGEKFSRDEYRSITNEFLVPHSYCKRSRYNGQPFSVGALARVNILGERIQGEAGEMYRKYFNDRWKKNPLLHVAAQALEIMVCFERIPQLVDLILKDKTDPDLVPVESRDGRGTGAVEAPRGLLIHHYEIADGLVQSADIITPTAMNAEDIERYCQIAAQKLMDEGREDEIKSRMDLVVRAFDPCISCSAHTVEIERAPTDNWKRRLREMEAVQPLFVGVGNPDRADDAVGLDIARELRRRGMENVRMESELEENGGIGDIEDNRPVVFIDAVQFGEEPGRITFIALDRALHNVSLSHRFVPFLSGHIRPERLKNAFILGIQPQTTQPGEELSPEVRAAAARILSEITN